MKRRGHDGTPAGRVWGWLAIFVIAGAMGGVLTGPGCQKPDTAVGALCQTGEDCTNEAKPQVCAATPGLDGAMAGARICTRSCQARSDCPLGFECLAAGDNPTDRRCFPCRADLDCPVGTYCLGEGADGGAAPADGGAGARSCREVKTDKAGFGKTCAVMGDTACDKAKGYFCHGEVADDPDAYCTKNCSGDVDCPTSMFCGTPVGDNVPGTRTRRCVVRTQCSPCRADVECSEPNSLCVPDDKGRGFCTRPCNTESSMPCTTAGSTRGHLECREVAKDLTKPDAKVAVCYPRYGSCFGKGEPCDPCRLHLPGDCQKATGRTCVVIGPDESSKYQGQGLCLQACSTDDDCPVNPKLEEQGLETHCRRVTTGDKACTAAPKVIPGTSVYEITCWP